MNFNNPFGGGGGGGSKPTIPSLSVKSGYKYVVGVVDAPDWQNPRLTGKGNTKRSTVNVRVQLLSTTDPSQPVGQTYRWYIDFEKEAHGAYNAGLQQQGVFTLFREPAVDTNGQPVFYRGQQLTKISVLQGDVDPPLMPTQAPAHTPSFAGATPPPFPAPQPPMPGGFPGPAPAVQHGAPMFSPPLAAPQPQPTTKPSMVLSGDAFDELDRKHDLKVDSVFSRRLDAVVMEFTALAAGALQSRISPKAALDQQAVAILASSLLRDWAMADYPRTAGELTREVADFNRPGNGEQTDSAQDDTGDDSPVPF